MYAQLALLERRMTLVMPSQGLKRFATQSSALPMNG
jgi:hypothetical protein